MASDSRGRPSCKSLVLAIEKLLIDILTSIYGVGTSELIRSAVKWTFTEGTHQLNLRVIHPILLLENIDLWDVIPLDEMHSSQGFLQFFSQRLKQLQDEVNDRRTSYLDALK